MEIGITDKNAQTKHETAMQYIMTSQLTKIIIIRL